MTDQPTRVRVYRAGVQCEMYRSVITYDPAQARVRLEIHPFHAPETVADFASFLQSVPSDAALNLDYEGEGYIDISWIEPATPEEIAQRAADLEAERVEAEKQRLFEGWLAEHYEPEPGATS